MERLSGLDAFFLYVETPTMHTHVALTAVLDPSTMPGGFSFERIRDHIAARVHLVPPFRRRAMQPLLRMHHPVWVDDPDFDIDHHIKRAALPAPGGLHELATLTGHIASIPLDRSRPLWEMWVIEGLEQGRIALVAKIHHSAMDGASGAELLPIFFGVEVEPAPVEVPAFEPEQAPDQWELLGMATVERLRSIASLPRLTRRTGEAIQAIRRRRRLGEGPSGGTPLTAPHSKFNGPITAERSVGFARIPLADVKHVKTVLGGTVNDVLLTTCALAFRRYLGDRDELPDQPLLAACPVSVRADDERGQTNNRLSVMFTPVHTDVADPLECLQVTRASAGAAKIEHQVLGTDTLASWAEVADPSASGLVSRLYGATGLASHHRPALTFILSNIPGPPFPVYLAGAKMERAYPMGPVLEGAGLNVTVLSYQDSVDFGFLAATRLVPDVWALADAVPEAFAELLAAADAASDTEAPLANR